MERETVLDTDYVSLWYYPDKKVIHNQFKKYLYGSGYRDFLNEVTNTIKKMESRNFYQTIGTTAVSLKMIRNGAIRNGSPAQRLRVGNIGRLSNRKTQSVSRQ